VFFCAREALKVMVAQQSGKIINIASIWGLAGSSSLFPALAYNAAKGAVINLTRELGLEYAKQGIQVNALCPGFYQTNLSRGAIDDPQVRASITAFIPMGRIAEAGEIKGPSDVRLQRKIADHALVRACPDPQEIFRAAACRGWPSGSD